MRQSFWSSGLTLLQMGTFGSFEEIEIRIGWRFEVEATVPGEPAGAARHGRWAHSPKPYRAAGPQARRR